MKSKAVLTLEAESCISTDGFIYMVLQLIDTLRDGYNVSNATKMSYTYYVDWGGEHIDTQPPIGSQRAIRSRFRGLEHDLDD